MSGERIRATYQIETAFPVEKALNVMLGLQGTGGFVKLPGETNELRERHGARVERITPLDSVAAPSLPGARVPKTGFDGTYNQAEVTLSYPLENMGANLFALVATVAGSVFDLSEVSGLRLVHLELPQAFADAHPGPQFAIDGTRKLTGVVGRPLIGTIIKPSVGLSPDQTAALVRELAEAGVDFIKDDELMANPPHAPLGERVAAVMHILNEHAAKTGRKVMYAFNVSDELDAMLSHHDTVLAHGGTCVMVSLNGVGLAGVERLRRHSQLPIHGHRNGWAMLTRCPALGMDFQPYQTLWRLAGVDHLHVNGIANKFWEPDDSVVAAMNDCLSPLLGTPPVLPVVSSGQWGGQAPETYRRVPTTDLLYLAGAAVMAHPSGPAGGVRALQQCWEAAVQNIPLADYARTHPELAQTLAKFGKKD